MEGVRVRARRWFTTYYAFPDYNGNYRMASCFRRPCNYSLVYARSYFAIRWHLFGTTAWINGPKLSGDWNFDMEDGIYRFAGNIFRGGFRYNYKDIGGLLRPWSFFNYRRQIYIAVNDNKNWQGINWEVFPIIKIARFKDKTGPEYGSDEIFSTTCHETGHTTHYLKVGTLQFVLTTSEIRESWAEGIEWVITHKEFAEREVANYGDETYSPTPAPSFPNEYAYQYWDKTTQSSENTPLFIDLIDNFNERDQFFPNKGVFGTVNDQVSGYTLPGIESYLSSSFSLQSLSVQLKGHKPVGVTDAQIDLLLSYY